MRHLPLAGPGLLEGIGQTLIKSQVCAQSLECSPPTPICLASASSGLPVPLFSSKFPCFISLGLQQAVGVEEPAPAGLGKQI